MADLATQLADAEARLEAARKMAGVAMLEGRDIDHMAMAAIEAEITSIHAAGGEIARKEREAAAEAERNRIAGLKDKLKRIDADRLEQAEKAEKAAKDLCSALRLWIAFNTDAARIVRALKGGGAGLLDPIETEMRISHMLGSTLKPLFGNRRKLGQISFFTILDRYAGSWRKLERDATDHEIHSALKGTEA
ncbi:MAG: hypothetical protein EOR68_02870 [Mesorhizobium sp.]|uniref:hypothetical protein n=1 Tax=Mesorhizobium sp. TaxID=1871066 RepID=UPI000FE4E1BE|nr:hypothetical protein [Mesorhizobium sp.]RWM04570.1 MAG: hypothetical protein EOR68_02870 [Mesorhizobium sp.]TIP42433.1 MAG: hypothetical protein E5X77_24200 [Mesorhizobium sp.]